MDALEYARDFLTESCLDERACVKAAIIVEELVSNCLHHSGPSGDIALQVVLTDKGDTVEVWIEDNGTAFDPTKAPEITEPNPRTGGGVGLAIVHAWSGDIAYSRNGDRNTLRLTIK